MKLKLASLILIASFASHSTAYAGNPPTSGWRLPRLWPFGSSTSARPNQPSTWQKLSSGTRSLFAKTADALNPWDDAQPPPPEKLTGSGSLFSRSSAKKPTASPSGSWLPSWPWGGKEEEKRPRTVTDFLAQPRPEY